MKITSAADAATSIQSVAAATEPASITNTLIAEILDWLRSEDVRLSGIIDEDKLNAITNRLQALVNGFAAMPDGLLFGMPEVVNLGGADFITFRQYLHSSGQSKNLSMHFPLASSTANGLFPKSLVPMLEEMAGLVGDADHHSWRSVLSRLASVELTAGSHKVDASSICYMVGVQPFDRIVYMPEELKNDPVGAIGFSIHECRFFRAEGAKLVREYARYNSTGGFGVRRYIYRSISDTRLYRPNAAGTSLEPFIISSDMHSSSYQATEDEHGLMSPEDKRFVSALTAGMEEPETAKPYAELTESVDALNVAHSSLSELVDDTRVRLFDGFVKDRKAMEAQPVGSVAFSRADKYFLERTEDGVRTEVGDYNYHFHGFYSPRTDLVFRCGNRLYRAAGDNDLVELAGADSVEAARYEHPEISCRIFNGELHLMGYGWYERHGYVPYLFRLTSKRNRYREVYDNKPAAIKGWNLFGSRHTVRLDQTTVLFRDSRVEDADLLPGCGPRHDLPATAYSPDPAAIVSPRLNHDGTTYIVPYGRRTILLGMAHDTDRTKIVDGRPLRLRFAIGFARPEDNRRVGIGLTDLVSGLAKFNIYISSGGEVRFSR